MQISLSLPSFLIPYICVSIQYLSFSSWLTSLCIIGSRFIHFIRTDSNAFLLSWVIFLCVYVPQFLYLVGYLCCFHFLAIVNSAAMNIGVHVYFSVMVSSGYMPSRGITGLYGSFIPRFLRNLHSVLHSHCINLHSHQKCKRVLFSPHPIQHLLFAD